MLEWELRSWEVLMCKMQGCDLAADRRFPVYSTSRSVSGEPVKEI